GVLRLMDETKSAGRKLAVCSAATKSSVILCLENLIGIDRFQNLDCFLAGDDVKEKKPDPSIYITASKKLGVSEKDCLVVEDSVIGLQAATKAGMQCVITYTTSTANQDFKEAIATYPDLSDIRLKDLDSLLQNVATTR
ncbi:HAD-IA family hydrolase, partial [Salmonella enterica subsp. enterica serovar 1,4,[5],12:i:-]|nr:HAD-IA family hydrolase [Salmonella enterica subsp. enterica serovar 1,4,[5],12:i:-]